MVNEKRLMYGNKCSGFCIASKKIRYGCYASFPDGSNKDQLRGSESFRRGKKEVGAQTVIYVCHVSSTYDCSYRKDSIYYREFRGKAKFDKDGRTIIMMEE